MEKCLANLLVVHDVPGEAADERHLRGGGTGVNAEETVTPIPGQALPADDGFAVAGAERLMVFPRGEQGVKAF